MRFLCSYQKGLHKVFIDRRQRFVVSMLFPNVKCRLKILVRQTGFSCFRRQFRNSLPSHVTSAPSLAIFRQRIKTFLVHLSYPDLLPRDALVHSAVLRLRVVRLSVCDVGGSGSHRLEILETNCTDT